MWKSDRHAYAYANDRDYSDEQSKTAMPASDYGHEPVNYSEKQAVFEFCTLNRTAPVLQRDLCTAPTFARNMHASGCFKLQNDRRVVLGGSCHCVLYGLMQDSSLAWLQAAK